MSKNYGMLTPDVVDSIVRNADKIKAAMNVETAATVQKSNSYCHTEDEAVGPQLVKFKFVLCDVEINNINAAAEENGPGCRA